MKLLKRSIDCTNEIKTANNNINEYLPHCQASFNSDDCITLRNYDRGNPNKDEIIVLSPTETAALFCLFSRLGEKNRQHTLPF